MNPETVLQLLRLLLRVVDAYFGRRPAAPRPETRADRVVAQVAPLAERVLDRVAPETAEAPPRRAARRRRRSLAWAQAAVIGAVASGAAAYLAVQYQQRLRERYRPRGRAFPDALLGVLAGPGGAGRLEYVEGALRDTTSGAVYAVVDGIPDFAGGDGQLPPPIGQVEEFLNPAAGWILGRSDVGNAALAGAIAAGAGEGWVLYAPCGMGGYEIEMARANPLAHVVCLSLDWAALLESRRRALQAGLENVYCVRGNVACLPLQDNAMDAAWTAPAWGFAEPAQALGQIGRVVKPGGLVAGALPAAGDVPALGSLAGQLGLGARLTLPPELLPAAGLPEAHVWREGLFVRFIGGRV